MDIPKWPKGLPHPTSWLRAIALSATFFGLIHLFWQNLRTASDIEKLATVAWFCQIPLLAGYHYAAVQGAQHLERSRPNSQNTRPLGSWQHWKEGLAGFFVLFLALIVTGPIADAIAPISYSRSYYRYYYYNTNVDKTLFIYGILCAIASAYLYYWKIPSRAKFLVVFCWPLINSYLKTQQLLFIPIITCLPFLAAVKLAIKLNLSGTSWGLVTLLIVFFAFFAIAAAFAAIHYYGAHWVNWIATWWPESFPGYGYLQQRKAQKHNASVNQNFIYHQTSWKLAAHDFTVLMYANVLANLVSLPIYLVISNGVSVETLVKLSLASYFIWTVIAIILWHSWGRTHAAKIISASIKTAKNKQTKRKKTQKSSPPKKPQPPVDPIEIELNQMSADFGMTPMNPVRKIPDPNQTQWYVFRSGQSEGPYTREQLWLEQKISDRTNVRRAEEDNWTRAGDIPELADFLTTKI